MSLENIKPERRAIDRIVMADILRLSDEEQLEGYRALADVVRSRRDKAGSVTSAATARQRPERACFPTTR